MVASRLVCGPRLYRLSDNDSPPFDLKTVESRDRIYTVLVGSHSDKCKATRELRRVITNNIGRFDPAECCEQIINVLVIHSKGNVPYIKFHIRPPFEIPPELHAVLMV